MAKVKTIGLKPRRRRRRRKKPTSPKPKIPDNHKTLISSIRLKDYLKDKTVAVVGNSPSPIDVAEEVDAHDVVVRFNLHNGRLLEGYDTIRPNASTGVKTTIFSASWVTGQVNTALELCPDIEMFLCTRGGTAGFNRLRDAGVLDTGLMVYLTPKIWVKALEAWGNGGVLSGMVVLEVLRQVDTAKAVDIYNWNFYTPALNPINYIPETSSKIYHHNSMVWKGDPDDPGSGHCLTTDYLWFKHLLGHYTNFKWVMHPKRIRKVERFLLPHTMG